MNGKNVPLITNGILSPCFAIQVSTGERGHLARLTYFRCEMKGFKIFSRGHLNLNFVQILPKITFLLDKIMEKKFKDFFCSKVEFDTKEFFHALPSDVHFIQPKVSKIVCYSTEPSVSSASWNQHQIGFLWKIWIGCGNILIGQWFCGMDIRYFDCMSRHLQDILFK